MCSLSARGIMPEPNAFIEILQKFLTRCIFAALKRKTIKFEQCQSSGVGFENEWTVIQTMKQ